MAAIINGKEYETSMAHDLGYSSKGNYTMYLDVCSKCGNKIWRQKQQLDKLCKQCTFYKRHPDGIFGANNKRNKKEYISYYQRKDWCDLEDLYVKNKLSIYAISKIKHCSAGAVYHALKRKNIVTRSLSDARKNRLLREDNSPNYKGGRLSYGGYVSLLKRDHPNCSKEGYVLEHRLIMEKEIGRYLTKQEHVHHKNHVKSDNRIENLEILSPSNHIVREQLCSNCPLYMKLHSETIEEDELIDIRCA